MFIIILMDPLKEAFKKVKEDIDSIKKRNYLFKLRDIKRN